MEPADLPGPFVDLVRNRCWTSGAHAASGPRVWTTWGVGEWSLAATVIGIGIIVAAILAVAVPYAIRRHERKDAQRAEERRERIAALREILAAIGAHEIVVVVGDQDSGRSRRP